MGHRRRGLGSITVGPDEQASATWGAQDDADSIAAIRHAVASGVNWIDTAAVYGLGHSEEVVAAALRDIPAAERPYPATEPTAVAAPASIRREVEGSLRRLGTERIDLYQVHWPARDGTSLEEYWQTLLELKAEGKIRAAGLSNHSAEQLTLAEKLGHVDTRQPPFSAIQRDAAAEELPWCAAHETGVIVYSPMQAGLLTGAFSRERAAALPADDWRSRSDHFTGAGLTANLALAEADLAEITEAIISTGAGSGPARP
ncbi:aldo/keto reductase [Crossiella sp. SN42]|uniref:aldo/keto reductase n=1 Tax=Crossiella sp. SN42 TaxID=2944808 RepID=UPI00207D6B15|nr:aldo/keto reductase [Crossiella sp. SN42]MCO1576375.1 aldo/keto reductase [Crossiella sp. SN42]